MNVLAYDWNGKAIGIGTLVNVDNGANVKNKSGAVTEVIFKGDERDDIYLRVSGIKNLTSLQYVTVLDLSELEWAIYSCFALHNICLNMTQIKDYSEKILEAVSQSDDDGNSDPVEP